MKLLEEKELVSYMRKLAKGYKYQNLYNLSKEMKLRLFYNDRDFSEMQIQFLSWLNFYYAIKWDIDMGDIGEKVLENFIYEESYIYWKSKNKGKDKTKNERTNKPNNEPKKSIQWIFKKE